jgi:hypothetical protein
MMIASFVNKDAFTAKFESAQTKLWLDTNNDQHIWICGSFFQFSAGEGWDRLQGFDISPESAGKNEGIMRMIDSNKKMNIYVVQAVKVAPDETIDSQNAEKSFRTKMWVLPVLEERDKKLVAPRLARTYLQVENHAYRTSVESKVDLLPKVYETLVKMDQFSFSFSMQAQLATDLITDPDFNANDSQIRALKMGKLSNMTIVSRYALRPSYHHLHLFDHRFGAEKSFQRFLGTIRETNFKHETRRQNKLPCIYSPSFRK